MTRKLMFVGTMSATVSAALVIGTPANADIYSDDLSRCVVAKTSDQDKIAMMQWMFAVMASHPSVAKFSTVTAKDREGTDRAMASLTSRLLLTDCRSQAVAAVKYEGNSAVERAFGTLGKASMVELSTHPVVNGAFGGFAKFINDKDFDALFAEAGKTRGTPPAK